jgi:hypothetical protein
LSKAERKADHYRKEAVRYHELAKFARPEYLGDFYRRIAVRYLFMAEDVTKWAERGAIQSDALTLRIFVIRLVGSDLRASRLRRTWPNRPPNRRFYG